MWRSGPSGERLEEFDVVEIVSTAAAELLPSVTELGVKLHREINGAPEQARFTVFAKDEPMGAGSTLKLYVTDCPAVMVCVVDGASAVNVKS